MDALPNELLAYILAFLHPVYGELSRLSIVCKRWREVIENTASLWKCIHFTPSYPEYLSSTTRDRSKLRHCLFKFGHFVTCLRDDAKTFTDPALQGLLCRLKNLTRLDVPLLECDLQLLQTLQCANVLEELNLTKATRDDLNWLFQPTYSLEKGFVTPQHLQMLLLRFPHLKVLKLALDSIASPPPTFIAFLQKANLRELELTGFSLRPALPPHIIHNRDMCLKTIASSQRLAAIVTRLELETCPLFFTSDHLRIMLKLMVSLRHLIIGAGMVHRDRKSLLSIESPSLCTLMLDGLSTLRMQCLRCNTPLLKEFQLANCLDLTAAFVFSESLESMCLRNLANIHNLKSTSTRLNHLEFVGCHSMPITTLRNFLKGHKTISKLSIVGELTGLTLFGTMCPNLKVLNILLYQVPKLRSIKIDCPTLEHFHCDVYNRGLSTPDEPEAFSNERSTCSIFIRGQKLNHVSINLPNATAIAVKCEELGYLSVKMSETESDNKAALDFEVISGTIALVTTTNCKFSRYHLQSRFIDQLTLELCEIESGGETIPRLEVHTKAIDRLRLVSCLHLQCAELRIRQERIEHVSFTECNNLRNIVMSRAVKHTPEMTVVKCRSLESIFLSSGRCIDVSALNVACYNTCLNVPRLPQRCDDKTCLICPEKAEEDDYIN